MNECLVCGDPIERPSMDNQTICGDCIEATWKDAARGGDDHED